MDKTQALNLWDQIYGPNCKWKQDCFGTWMYRDDYGDQDTMRKRISDAKKAFNYGWEVDHIRPKSSFEKESEASFLNNYEPMHWMNNREKADNYPHFTIENVQYAIVKCSICNSNNKPGYGIKKTSNGKRVDWKAVQNEFFS